MVHVPKEARRKTREAAVAVGRHRTSAAHADVGILDEAAHQALDDFRADDEVRAGDANGLDVRMALRKIGVDRSDLAPSLGLLEEDDGDSGSGLALAHDVGGAVGAAAGDDDDLDDLGGRGALGPQRVEERTDVAFLIVGGNGDADLHRKTS